MTEFVRKAINFILFQVAWFAAVLGAAYGAPWLGVVAVPAVFGVHLALAEDRRAELVLALASAVLGFAADSLLIAAGVFSPIPHLFPSPLSAPWMVMLWVNLAMTLNASMAWVRGRYALGSVFGAIGGPIAYLSGAKLGAMIEVPGAAGLLAIGASWAFALPAMLKINEVLRSFFGTGREGA
jgi:hypothetical protein